MKRIILIIILLSAAKISASGFDNMMLWRFDLPAYNSKSFSFEPLSMSKQGINAILLHADPYRISSLYWNYAAFKYGMGKWGFYGSARFYGLKDLYSNDRVELGALYRPNSNIAFALSTNHELEQYSGYEQYIRIDFDAKISGSVGNFIGMIDVDKINVEKPYDFPGVATPEPMIYGAYRSNGYYQLSVGAKRLNTKRTRWFFDQDINIIDNVGVRLGFYNNPNVFNWGLDLNWRLFTFEFTYFAVSKLNDTMALGLSFAM